MERAPLGVARPQCRASSRWKVANRPHDLAYPHWLLGLVRPISAKPALPNARRNPRMHSLFNGYGPLERVSSTLLGGLDERSEERVGIPHQGHYDTIEREFRGFGYVEQTDTESFGKDHGQGQFPP